ncbi:hypothetical protein ANABIO32_42430 [Rossellomorea marisflavi]|nr:hypothetical protein ANABIO32_42430 [Rossellomorea marisflavi]
MYRLLRISFLDFKYTLKNKALLSTILFTVTYTFIFFIYLSNSTIDKNHNTYYQVFNDISFYIFLIIPAVSFSKEYSFKTSRIIYTGVFSEYQVFIYKVVSTCLFILTLGIFHRVIGNVFWGLDQGDYSIEILSYLIGKTLYIYGFTGLFTISLAFFFTLIFYNRLGTVIFTVAIFILERFLRGILLIIMNSELIVEVVKHNPLAIVQNALQYGSLTIMDGFILIVITFVLNATSLIIIRRKAVD